jgi:RNA-binding protein
MITCAPRAARQTSAMPLTRTQLRYLRGLAHDLKPVILVGAKGLSENLLAELEGALEHHELVKLRIAAEERDARNALALDIASRVGAETVQRIGHTLSLFRRNAEKPRIALPR